MILNVNIVCSVLSLLNKLFIIINIPCFCSPLLFNKPTQDDARVPPILCCFDLLVNDDAGFQIEIPRKQNNIPFAFTYHKYMIKQSNYHDIRFNAVMFFMK